MTTANIYGEVETLSDVRGINKQIRDEIRGAKNRGQVTELKKRSDYLCTLAIAPSWQKKFGSKAPRVLEVAKEEDERTTRVANSIVRQRNLGGDSYHPWQGG